MAEPTRFDYAKALEVVKDNPFGLDFLKSNQDRLMELGTQAGLILLQEIVDLFAAGNNREAWKKFYGKGSWADLAAGAATDVHNTADMAQRWKAFGDFLRSAGEAAAKVLLSILVAGFLA
jgi:hypothetical protein